MRTTTLGENLIQITRLGFVNAYLVRESDGFTLVDTTTGGGADGLIEAARAAGGEITTIALTHAHGDHAGSLDALVERLGSGTGVHMGELDARILAGEQVAEGKLRGSWPKVSTVPAPLAPGDRVGSLEAVPSPGHTPGHFAFLDTRDRTLIAGDVFTAIGRVSVSSHFYWRFPLAAGATWDRAKDVESARTLTALDPRLLVVGHGPATRDPQGAMAAAVERAAAKARS